MASSSSATPARILAAAEALFADNGYANITLRQITAHAGVNLAAVNYHFFDKETLYRELLTQRLRQINHQRAVLLEAAEARAPDGLAPLDEIMDALARPAFLPEGAFTPASARLLGRVLLEQATLTEGLLQQEFQPMMTRIGQALRRHQPGLPPADFLWRFSFIVGALHHSLATLPNMHALTQGICRDNDANAALGSFTKFAIAAMR
ncbi:putative DNA-binding transcriptional regulator [Lacunisphaera limnophila]|uniref:Putative DNA-binding transcriptional regulator n=1 Tax=Lacunisphaera limnophila TaxID=1838286 RepID=A0A1D8ASR3_9BACT|nr:TetR/AcrR family transcriptional regulator [Lacunisphaera limnophila]AOS43902.1 putative DNA-binding transcriptional regulator [Lacunisphaera limnophila]